MTVNINGDLSQWTMGADPIVAAASGQMLADCWRLHKAGAAVHTVRPSTDVPHPSLCGRVIPNSMEIEVTTPDAAVSATDVTALVYRGEGSELAELVERRIPFEFWLKGIAGSYAVHLSFGAETLSCAVPIKLDDTDKWTRFIGWAPWPVDAVLGTDLWTDNRVGITFALVLMAGSNFQGELDKWHSHAASAFKFAGVGQSNFNATLGNKMKIAGVRIGDGQAMFQPPEFVEQACMRYVEKSFERTWTPANGVGFSGEHRWPCSLAGAAAQPSERVRYAVPKRKAASVIGYNPINGNSQAIRVTGPIDCTATAFNAKTAFGFQPIATSPAGTTVGQELAVHWVADASLPALGTNIGG